MSHRPANTEPPKTIDEARQRSIDVETEIAALKNALEAKFRYRDDDGMPMDPEEYITWRKRATGAMNWYMREQKVVMIWIKDYERDVKAEELAEQRELKREAAKESARLHYESQASYQEWQERMIREHGTARAPVQAFRAQQIELEKLRAERRQQILAIQENNTRLSRQRHAHKEWLERLNINDPINGLDPENLLAHAHRLLRQLREENRVDYTWEERTLLDVIEQRFLILANLGNPS